MKEADKQGEKVVKGLGSPEGLIFAMRIARLCVRTSWYFIHARQDYNPVM
jgi:hypothetical protein